MSLVFAPRPRAWARADYERLLAAGILGPGDRVELLEGEIIEMIPEKSRHAAAVDLTLEALRRHLGSSHTIRVQHPRRQRDLGARTRPGRSARFSARLRRSPSVVGRPAGRSVRQLPRVRPHAEARVYADAGVPEYWIVNLVESVLEVHRDPGRSGYRSVTTRRPGKNVAPLVAPGAGVAVADLLP